MTRAKTMNMQHFLVMAAVLLGGVFLFAATVFVLIRSSWNRRARPQAAPSPLLTAGRRTAALARAARTLRMQFEERLPLQAVEELGDFVLFSQGNRKAIYNRLAGWARHCRIEVFDYYYDFRATSGGRRGFGGLIVLLKAPAVSFPQFDLRPTTSAWVDGPPGDPPWPLKKLRELFGAARRVDECLFGTIPSRVRSLALVEFPVQVRFSELYVVHAEKPHQVEELFSEDVVSHFEHHPGVHVEAKDGVMVYWRDDELPGSDPQRWLLSPEITASDVHGLISEAQEAFRLLSEAGRTAPSRQELSESDGSSNA